MGRELGDVGLSPFSISLSLELMGMLLCFCPALGLGLVEPGPTQSMLCWAEAFPWLDPKMQVSVGQLCTAPASSLEFGALMVGPVFCSLEVLLSPVLCPAPSTPGHPCAITARATPAPRRTRTRWTSVWSKGATSRHCPCPPHTGKALLTRLCCLQRNAVEQASPVWSTLPGQVAPRAWDGAAGSTPGLSRRAQHSLCLLCPSDAVSS